MTFNFDFSGTSKFFDDMEKFKLGFRDFVKEELEVSTTDLVRDIKNITPVDTGELRNAWNYYIISPTGRKRTFTVYINNPKDYASYMEDGYYTSKTSSRFVPGYWNGNKFIYKPNTSSEGMVLKRKWIEGKHMYRISINKWERYFNAEFNTSLSRYIKSKKVM